MAIKLGYAIHFVADMNRPVAFYRDTVGLELKFASPDWSEFSTGTTTLALHPASKENPAGTTHPGLHTDDIAAVHRTLTAAGVRFTRVPTPEQGITLAELVDSEGARVSLLLDGLRATTHWLFFLQKLQELFPKVTVDSGSHVVKAGKVITSAGIDMALHVVTDYFGEDIARATACDMEYPFPETNERRVAL